MWTKKKILEKKTKNNLEDEGKEKGGLRES